MSNKLLCSSWIYRWNCFKFQVHTEIFSRGINDRNCGIYSIQHTQICGYITELHKNRNKNQKQLLLHDKHQILKKYLGLLIKGTNILSLKPHSETAPTPIDRVTLRLAREMYTHAQERNGYCLPSIYMIS